MQLYLSVLQFWGKSVHDGYVACKSVPLWEHFHFLWVVSALGKVSCLYSDVREQDSTGGNTDDRTVLTPLNPQKLRLFPTPAYVRYSPGFLGGWNADPFICIWLLEHMYAPASANS